MPRIRAVSTASSSDGSQTVLLRGTSPSRRSNLLVPLFLVLLPMVICAAAADPQNSKDEPQKANRGTFLVATRELDNPVFGNTVILMLPIKEIPHVVGVIVNKPTHVLLRDLFPDSKSLAKQESAAYFGGPVDMDQPSAIFRSKTPPKNATAVFADVYVTLDSDTIAALAEDSRETSGVRIFMGRSQWDPGQLADEVARGAWYSTDDDADLVFNPRPDTVWRALLKRLAPRPLV